MATTIQDLYDAGLSVLELRNIYANTLKTTPPFSADDKLPDADAWFLWVALLLKRVKPELTSEQRQLILGSLWTVQATQVQKSNSFMLSFVDGKLFTHTGLRGFIRLDTGAYVSKLPSLSIMSVAYDLTNFITLQTREVSDANTIKANAGVSP